MRTIATIGFAGKNLQEFVGLLNAGCVSKVIDTRLRPNSQLSAYARGVDLAFLLPTYERIQYEHHPDLAPTPEVLDLYRKDKDWSEYVERFQELIRERDMAAIVSRSATDHEVVALLCSEPTADQCHRRLVAEAVATHSPDVEVIHL